MGMMTYLSADYAGKTALAEHTHEAAQILFSRQGVMELTTEGKLFVIPSSRVAWIPGGVRHSIRFRTATSLRTAYVDFSPVDAQPTGTTVYQCSALFRPLMLRLVEATDLERPYRALLEELLLREIGLLRHESFAVVFPRDRRARRVARHLVEAPENRASLNQWGTSVGCSGKTLGRIFRSETDLPFRLWRRQVRLLASLPLLEQGQPIAQVALAVGFSTPSAYAEAFRLTFGRTPTRHLTASASD